MPYEDVLVEIWAFLVEVIRTQSLKATFAWSKTTEMNQQHK
jgi:hypothetical protein